MEAERALLRTQLADVKEELSAAHRRCGDLSQELVRETIEFDRKHHNATEELATAEVRAREAQSQGQQGERRALDSQKEQLEQLAKNIRETAQARAEETARGLRAEIDVLRQEVEGLTREHVRVMESKIPLTRRVLASAGAGGGGAVSGGDAENDDSENPHVARFLFKLLKMRESWREKDVESIVRFIREEVREEAQAVATTRHSAFLGDKLVRTRMLQQHQAETADQFNQWRIKRSLQNEETRQQTLASVRDKAKKDLNAVRSELRDNVARLEQVMETETHNTHQELRRTIDSVVEQRRSHMAQEDAEAERKLADARSRSSTERRQHTDRLEAELGGAKGRLAAVSAGSLDGGSGSLALGRLAAAGASPGGAAASQDGGGVILSDWFKDQRARLREDAAQILTATEFALGQFRGAAKTHAGHADPRRFEHVDELTTSIELKKATVRDTWNRLFARIADFSAHSSSVESAAGILRCDVVSQSVEAEAVRHEWERDLRRKMAETVSSSVGGGGGASSSSSSIPFGSRASEYAVVEVAMQLRNKFARMRQNLTERSARVDEMKKLLEGGAEQINQGFEGVLMATTGTLDRCADLAAAMARSQLLEEMVGMTQSQIEEEQQYVEAVKKNRERVTHLIKKAPLATVVGDHHQQQDGAGAGAAAREDQRQAQRHQQRSQKSSSRRHHRHFYEQHLEADQQHRARSSSTSGGGAARSMPSARALKDPFVKTLYGDIVAAAEAQQRQHDALQQALHLPRNGVNDSSYQSTQPPSANGRDEHNQLQQLLRGQQPEGHDSFEQLVAFSDSTASPAAAPPLRGDGAAVMEQMRLQQRQQRQQLEQFQSTLMPTPRERDGALTTPTPDSSE